MPRGKHIRLIIGVDGGCSIHALNFTDASCQSVTTEIQAALGGCIVQEQLKPEARIRERCGQGEREQAR